MKAAKPQKAVKASDFYCCMCGRVGEYSRHPVTNRLSVNAAWCRDCYERESARSIREDATREKNSLRVNEAAIMCRMAGRRM